MKTRHTLMLAGVLAVLCAGYWGLAWWRQQAQEAAVEAKRLFSFESAAVTALEIARVGEAPSAAVRAADGTWRIEMPNASIEPMPLMWDRVAQALAQLKNERTIVQHPADVSPYGLTTPALTLSARTNMDQTIRLTFGNEDAAKTHRYAQGEDGAVFLVDKTAFFEMNRSLEELRNRFLVRDREAALLRLEFARIWTGRGATVENAPPVGTESVQVTLERPSQDAPWRLIAPMEAAANQEAVNALASEIQFAVGRDFVDAPESLSDYGLDPPAFRVTIRDAREGTPQTMFFGEQQGGGEVSGAGKGTSGEDGKTTGRGLYAKRADSPSVFLVDAHLATLFPQAPDSLRERRIVTRDMSTLRRLEYRARDGVEFVLERAGGAEWRMTAPDQSDTDQVAVSHYLSLLKLLEAASFPPGDAAAKSLEAPAAALTLTWDGDANPAVIRLAPVEDGGSHYYITQDTGVAAMAHRNKVEQIMVTSDSFRSREVLRFPIPEAIRLAFAFEGKEYALEKIHETWVGQLPTGLRVENQSDVLAILAAISPLTARGVETATEEPGRYGLETPVLSITVTTRGANGQEVTHGPVQVGKITEERSTLRFASVAGRPGVFQIGQEVVDTVREALLGLRVE